MVKSAATTSDKVRKTHPGLYRLLMLYALGCFALATNFLIFTPTFYVYGQPNRVWSASFLVVALALTIFANVYRSMHLMKMTMAVTVVYFLLFAVGASEPTLKYVFGGEKEASLQLPLMYLWMAALMYGLLKEPFVNPATEKENGEKA